MSDSLANRAATVAGRTPPWVPPSTWHDMIVAGAVAIAELQCHENDGTPEEYAAAAIRAALPLIHGRAWKVVADLLGERMENHGKSCDNGHTDQTYDPECPFCQDIHAYRVYVQFSRR